jgi:hypothetical protein
MAQRKVSPARCGPKAAPPGDLNLVPSQTAYRRHGKGPKQLLRFTKTGDPNLEAAYSRRFVWPGRREFNAPDRPEAATAVDENPRSPSPHLPRHDPLAKSSNFPPRRRRTPPVAHPPA